jgi:hypothetical protein
MRDLDTIDAELRLLAAVRWSIREHGGEPSSGLINELLDERNKLTDRPNLIHHPWHRARWTALTTADSPARGHATAWMTK